MGKAEGTAAYARALLGQSMLEPRETEKAPAPIRRYPPVAVAPMRAVSVTEDGSLVSQAGKYERLAVWPPADPVTTGRPGSSPPAPPADGTLAARPRP